MRGKRWREPVCRRRQFVVVVEADFVVNILEDGLAKEAALQAYQNNFKTESGKNICQEMFAL